MALFTRENAREMALRGNKVKWAPKPPPVIETRVADVIPDQVYSSKRLARTRTQIDLLSTRLENELDGKNLDAMLIDRIASAIARLSIIERELSGRPLPGTLKPTSKPARLMLSPAVDAGHAQATREQPSTPPVVEPSSPENP